VKGSWCYGVINQYDSTNDKYEIVYDEGPDCPVPTCWHYYDEFTLVRNEYGAEEEDETQQLRSDRTARRIERDARRKRELLELEEKRILKRVRKNSLQERGPVPESSSPEHSPLSADSSPAPKSKSKSKSKSKTPKSKPKKTRTTRKRKRSTDDKDEEKEIQRKRKKPKHSKPEKETSTEESDEEMDEDIESQDTSPLKSKLAQTVNCTNPPSTDTTSSSNATPTHTASADNSIQPAACIIPITSGDAKDSAIISTELYPIDFNNTPGPLFSSETTQTNSEMTEIFGQGVVDCEFVSSTLSELERLTVLLRQFQESFPANSTNTKKVSQEIQECSREVVQSLCQLLDV